MVRDALANFVINEARGIVSSDGGEVELTKIEGSTAYVRYKKGHNPRCIECVLSPADFRHFLMELFGRKAPHIKEVELEVIDA
jgi:Fe-S cluster biogenesis protein NfuA